jgi:hypothetical protein
VGKGFSVKVYAIVCEYGAASIYEGIEMVCKTRKIAESYYLNEDFIGRPVRVDEMVVWDKKWEKIPKAPQSRKSETRLSKKKAKK